mmetsp:Transcript_26020/g.65582  ORF Transcript_26020/g.65582 Transcript_26020/m.65582 type:complete len:254 (+) Transcript_26020:1230-1991(+)
MLMVPPHLAGADNHGAPVLQRWRHVAAGRAATCYCLLTLRRSCGLRLRRQRRTRRERLVGVLLRPLHAQPQGSVLRLALLDLVLQKRAVVVELVREPLPPLHLPEVVLAQLVEAERLLHEPPQFFLQALYFGLSPAFRLVFVRLQFQRFELFLHGKHVRLVRQEKVLLVRVQQSADALVQCVGELLEFRVNRQNLTACGVGEGIEEVLAGLRLVERLGVHAKSSEEGLIRILGQEGGHCRSLLLDGECHLISL